MNSHWIEYDDNLQPETWALVAIRITGAGKDYSKEPGPAEIASWYRVQTEGDQEAIRKALPFFASERARATEAERQRNEALKCADKAESEKLAASMAGYMRGRNDAAADSARLREELSACREVNRLTAELAKCAAGPRHPGSAAPTRLPRVEVGKARIFVEDTEPQGAINGLATRIAAIETWADTLTVGGITPSTVSLALDQLQGQISELRRALEEHANALAEQVEGKP